MTADDTDTAIRPGNRRQVTVKITPDIIESATRRDSSHCMISDAIREQHPDAAMIATDLATIRFTDRKTKKRYIYLTPPLAQRALVNFDQGIPAEPFQFVLRRPAQILTSGMGKRRPAKVTQPELHADGGPNKAPVVVDGRPLPPRTARRHEARQPDRQEWPANRPEGTA